MYQINKFVLINVLVLLGIPSRMARNNNLQLPFEEISLLWQKQYRVAVFQGVLAFFNHYFSPSFGDKNYLFYLFIHDPALIRVSSVNLYESNIDVLILQGILISNAFRAVFIPDSVLFLDYHIIHIISRV